MLLKMRLKLGARTGLARNPGSKAGAELSTLTTSRKFCPSPKPASNAAISVAAGLAYSLDGGSTWTSNSGTWGTAKYCVVRLTSSGSYSTEVKKAITINSVGFDFSVTTKADPATGVTPWDDSAIWDDTKTWVD